MQDIDYVDGRVDVFFVMFGIDIFILYLVYAIALFIFFKFVKICV
jgi:hypothetical protein